MRILVYSKNMSRKSKFNEETARRLVDLVHKGSNFKSACLEVGISEDSFARYRKASPDFNKQIKNAQKSFKEAKNFKGKTTDDGRKSEIIHEDGIDSHLATEKPLKTSLNAPEGISGEPEIYMGLPVHRELNDNIPPYEHFYYPPDDSVLFYNCNRALFSCPSDLWRGKNNFYGDGWTEESRNPI